MQRMINFCVRYGLYLFVFLLPLQTRYIFWAGTLNGADWGFGTLSFYATEVLLLLIVILGLIGHALEKGNQEELIRRRVALHIIIFSFLLVVAALVSVFFAENRALALRTTLHLMEGLGLLTVLLHSEYSSHRLGQWFVGSTVIQSLIAIVQFFSQNISASTLFGISEKLPQVSGISVFETSAGRFLRSYGTFDHPNILAAYLVTALIICLALFFSNRSKLERVLLAGAQVILTAGLFYTLSRTGLIIFILVMVGILLYTLVNHKNALRKIWYFSAASSFIVLALLAIIHRDIVVARYASSQIINTPSVTERVSQYAEARELIINNWQTGVGIGNYTLALSHIRPNESGGALQPVHNVFLLIFVETGTLGIVIFIFFLYELLKPIIHFDTNYAQEILKELEKYSFAVNYEKDYGKYTYWFVSLSALIVGFLCWFFFDHFFWTIYSGIMLWWLILGLWLRQLVRIKR